jgi:hypothetical protein
MGSQDSNWLVTKQQLVGLHAEFLAIAEELAATVPSDYDRRYQLHCWADQCVNRFQAVLLAYSDHVLEARSTRQPT